MTLLAEKKPDVFQYEDILSLPEGHYEIVDGVKQSMSPTGFMHGLIEGKLFDFLDKHLSAKGFVAAGGVGILISKSPLRVRGADIVYITKESYPKPPAGILETPPELVAEILSPANTAKEMNSKLRDYLSIGIPNIVFADFENEIVTKYHSDGSFKIFSFSEEFVIYDTIKIQISTLLG
ncbi:MAG TPA: Uma2 family endonuclease [Leptospiraceae bacterium]|nr:Uma2 family endonuclease [Leptospiraceae bacterium]